MVSVVGGTFGATLVHFPFTQVIKFGARLKVIFSMKKHNFQKDIDYFVQLAEKVEKEGKSSILPDVESHKDHFIKTSLQLFVVLLQSCMFLSVQIEVKRLSLQV